MPLFKFKVSDANGTISELLIEGDSQADATRRVQRRGLVPLDFLGTGTASAASGSIFTPGFNVVDFTERLVPLLEANIPLERSLGIVGDDPDNPAMASTAPKAMKICQRVLPSNISDIESPKGSGRL